MTPHYRQLIQKCEGYSRLLRVSALTLREADDYEDAVEALGAAVRAGELTRAEIDIIAAQVQKEMKEQSDSAAK